VRPQTWQRNVGEPPAPKDAQTPMESPSTKPSRDGDVIALPQNGQAGTRGTASQWGRGR